MSSAQTIGCRHVLVSKTCRCSKCGVMLEPRFPPVYDPLHPVPEPEAPDPPRKGPHVQRSFGHRLWLAKMARSREQARGLARWGIVVAVTVAHGWWWLNSQNMAIRWAVSRWLCRTVLGQLLTEHVASLLCWALHRQAPGVRYDHAKAYAERVRASAWGGGES